MSILRNVRRKWLEVVVTILSLYNHDVVHPHEHEPVRVSVSRRVEVTR